MHSLRRKGIIGTRKVGRCIGNCYFPYEKYPFKLSADGERNTLNFKIAEGHKIASAVDIFLIGIGVGHEKWESIVRSQRFLWSTT